VFECLAKDLPGAFLQLRIVTGKLITHESVILAEKLTAFDIVVNAIVYSVENCLLELRKVALSYVGRVNVFAVVCDATLLLAPREAGDSNTKRGSQS
jgi:hypothetical protein